MPTFHTLVKYLMPKYQGTEYYPQLKTIELHIKLVKSDAHKIIGMEGGIEGSMRVKCTPNIHVIGTNDIRNLTVSCDFKCCCFKGYMSEYAITICCQSICL